MGCSPHGDDGVRPSKERRGDAASEDPVAQEQGEDYLRLLTITFDYFWLPNVTKERFLTWFRALPGVHSGERLGGQMHCSPKDCGLAKHTEARSGSRRDGRPLKGWADR